jgi:hypothetical protein
VIQAHQPHLRLLVRRIEGGHAAQGLDGRGRLAAGLAQTSQFEQQRDAGVPQRLPAGGEPVLVQVLGQQVAGVQRRGGRVGRRLTRAVGGRRGGLERRHVDDQWPHGLRRPQHQPAAGQGEGAGRERGGRATVPRRQCVPGHVQGLAQIVGPGCRRVVGPERLQDLVAVQALARRQGEELHQALGLAQPPGALRHRPAAGPDAEAAQQLDAQPHRFDGLDRACRRHAGVPHRRVRHPAPDGASRVPMGASTATIIRPARRQSRAGRRRAGFPPEMTRTTHLVAWMWCREGQASGSLRRSNARRPRTMTFG